MIVIGLVGYSIANEFSARANTAMQHIHAITTLVMNKSRTGLVWCALHISFLLDAQRPNCVAPTGVRTNELLDFTGFFLKQLEQLLNSASEFLNFSH